MQYPQDKSLCRKILSVNLDTYPSCLGSQASRRHYPCQHQERYFVRVENGNIQIIYHLMLGGASNFLGGMLGMGPPCNIYVMFNKIEGRKMATVRDRSGQTYKAPVFLDGDDVRGKIKIEMLKSKSKVDHLGIRVELIGVIENLFDKSQTTNFINLGQELEPAGVLTESMEYTFSFNRVEKKFESYNGIIVRLRYFINVVINRNYNKITKEEEFIVYNPIEEVPFADKPIKMEVGIEDCLHIEFEFSRSVFNLKDCVLGKVFFNLVRIKIKHMELNVIRKETFGTGEKAVTESENLTKFEIMDGAPVKGECIPVRFYVASVELTPTYENINKRFSVRYYLNLVLVDEEDRRYFKQQEIFLWREKLPQQILQNILLFANFSDTLGTEVIRILAYNSNEKYFAPIKYIYLDTISKLRTSVFPLRIGQRALILQFLLAIFPYLKSRNLNLLSHKQSFPELLLQFGYGLMRQWRKVKMSRMYIKIVVLIIREGKIELETLCLSLYKDDNNYVQIRSLTLYYYSLIPYLMLIIAFVVFQQMANQLIHLLAHLQNLALLKLQFCVQGIHGFSMNLILSLQLLFSQCFFNPLLDYFIGFKFAWLLYKLNL